METQHARRPRAETPAAVMGLAVGLAVVCFLTATMAVAGHHCAALSGEFGLLGGGIPGVFFGLVTSAVVSHRRWYASGSVNGVTFTRASWGVAVPSVIAVVISVATAPTSTGTDCAL